MPLNIGVDICDDYITAYNLEEKSLFTVPAVICREKREDRWHIGEEAYRVALSGRGVLTDRLMSLMRKHGTSTIQRKPYSAEQLLGKLMGRVLSYMLGTAQVSDIDRLVISIRDALKSDMDSCLEAAGLAGLGREKVAVISHQEAFVHYMLNQERELTYNMAGLFDLTGENLSFYRMKVVRGGGRDSVVAEGIGLEEAFRLGILKNDSGLELGDRILTDAARKCLGNDIYSAVLLTGKGFERTDWASGFIEYICRKRRVMYEPGLFAIGAAICAGNSCGDAGRILYCDTRTLAGISLDVVVNDRVSKLILVPAGSPWYGVNTYAEVLLNGQDYVDITIEPVDRFKPRAIARIDLKEMPERPPRCTRVMVGICFESAEEMHVSVMDQGFGEIYPASGITINETIKL